MNSSVRSDLAIESAEMFNKTEKLRGVRIYEEDGKTSGIHIIRVIVENEEGAKKLGKDIGEYITLEVPMLDQTDVSYHREITGSATEKTHTGHQK